MPKPNGGLDKRFILAFLASFLLCNIVSWWLSDLLKRQNNRFKPTSDSCDSPAVSKSDRQLSNFCKVRPKPLLDNYAHLLPTMCALMLVGRFGFNQLAMVWNIKRHFSIAKFLCFPTHPRRSLSGLKTSLICAPFDQIYCTMDFLCIFSINHTLQKCYSFSSALGCRSAFNNASTGCSL